MTNIVINRRGLDNKEYLEEYKFTRILPQEHQEIDFIPVLVQAPNDTTIIREYNIRRTDSMVEWAQVYLRNMFGVSLINMITIIP